MSYERLLSPEIADDAVDDCAETQRQPSLTPTPPPPSSPSRGTALSVLWWPVLRDDDEDEPQMPETD